MVDDGLEPSKVTYLCVLKACVNLASLAQCRLIHEQIIINAYDADLEIGNSLVDFYSKCELPDEAQCVFRRLTKCDIVTWGALVAGYAQIGADSSVFDLLSEMSSYGFMPNNIIFTSILSACSCAGRIKQAQMYFKEMVLSYKVMPSVENYSCLIDLFGRVGSLEEAQRFFEVLPLHPDTVIWKSLLTSCRTHGSINLGQLCFGQAAGLDTEDAT
ncbi:hypothetical protein KP509_10G007000 [Ceratopteris richardii]|nr:hypothetical protein KP509_10G007000 [Ceratopteris richardii]